MNEKFDISEAIKRLKNGSKIANKEIKFAEYFYMKNKKLYIKFYSNPDFSQLSSNKKFDFFNLILNSEEFYEVV